MFHYLTTSKGEKPERGHHRCLIGFEFRNERLV